MIGEALPIGVAVPGAVLGSVGGRSPAHPEKNASRIKLTGKRYRPCKVSPQFHPLYTAMMEEVPT
jgi:hypothetical protein